MNRNATPAYSGLDGISDVWISRLGKAGYATKGVVYAIVGVLAVQAAIGSGGSAEGTQGAITEMADEPFGQVLLPLIAIGLFAYALWRFLEALLDPGHVGTDGKGLAKRTAYFASGLIYLGLSVWSTWLVLGRSAGQGSNQGAGGTGGSRQQWTAELLSQPFGPYLVGAIGAVIIGVGLYQFYSAYSAHFMKNYDAGAMSRRQRRWARRIGRFGISARAVTFVIIGGFFIQAAVQFDPSEARGLGAALQTFAGQPYGPWLMAVVAAGFIAYGIYCTSRARYSQFSIA